jgi:site-specific recombinase XerD
MNNHLTTVFTTFYESYQQARNPSLNTAKQIKGIIPAFLSFCMTQKDRELVEEIQKEDVIAYLNSLTGLRTSSRLTHLRWITVFLNWLYEPLHIIIQKPETIFYKGPPDIPRAIQKDLDAKEVQKILKTLPTLPVRDQAIGYLLLFRLLRIGELVNLKVEDVNLAQRFITIYKSKNGTSRQISIPSTAIEPLKQIMEGKAEDSLLFDLKPHAMLLHANQILEKSGVSRRGRSSHAFRHTGITNLLEEGEDPAVIAKMAGNTPLTIYRNYASNISAKAQKNGEEKLDRLRQQRVV